MACGCILPTVETRIRGFYLDDFYNKVTARGVNLHAADSVCSVACLEWWRGIGVNLETVTAKEARRWKVPLEKIPRLFPTGRQSGTEVAG